MTHAVLEFHRETMDCVEVMTAPDLVGLLEEREAVDFYRGHLHAELQRAHRAEAERVELSRQQFISRATVEESVSEAGQRGVPQVVDRVTIDGQPMTLRVGDGVKYLRDQAARSFPDPGLPPVEDAESWWNQNRTRRVVWRASISLNGDTSAVVVSPGDRGSRSLPLHSILGHLDSLQSEGWAIVHVSEDRQLDEESSVGGTSFVVGQRYLLRS